MEGCLVYIGSLEMSIVNGGRGAVLADRVRGKVKGKSVFGRGCGWLRKEEVVSWSREGWV